MRTALSRWALLLGLLVGSYAACLGTLNSLGNRTGYSRNGEDFNFYNFFTLLLRNLYDWPGHVHYTFQHQGR
jgi:hypothetical protein